MKHTNLTCWTLIRGAAEGQPKLREEFRDALTAVVASHHPGTPADVDRRSPGLIDLLE